jgi:hypothetical protein
MISEEERVEVKNTTIGKCTKVTRIEQEDGIFLYYSKYQ